MHVLLTSSADLTVLPGCSSCFCALSVLSPLPAGMALHSLMCFQIFFSSKWMNHFLFLLALCSSWFCHSVNIVSAVWLISSHPSCPLGTPPYLFPLTWFPFDSCISGISLIAPSPLLYPVQPVFRDTSRCFSFTNCLQESQLFPTLNSFLTIYTHSECKACQDAMNNISM